MIRVIQLNRLMEKKILDNINRVVNILIELSCMDGTNKGSHYDEAAGLLKEIHPLLLRLVDGKEELLDSLIKQLVSQKMPHPSILSSFGNLQNDLNNIISMALNLYQEKEEAVLEEPQTVPEPPAEDYPETDVPEEKIAAESPQGIIDIIYAKEKVIKDYFFRSLRFDYYLPERKVGILTTNVSRKHLIHDTLLKKEGISLVEINPNDPACVRKLPRFS